MKPTLDSTEWEVEYIDISVGKMWVYFATNYRKMQTVKDSNTIYKQDQIPMYMLMKNSK